MRGGPEESYAPLGDQERVMGDVISLIKTGTRLISFTNYKTRNPRDGWA